MAFIILLVVLVRTDVWLLCSDLKLWTRNHEPLSWMYAKWCNLHDHAVKYVAVYAGKS